MSRYFKFFIDLISAIDSWKKFIVLMLLLGFASVAYIVHTFQHEVKQTLSFLVLKKEIDDDLSKKLSTHLMKDKTIEKVTVWKVDFEHNMRDVIFSEDRSAGVNTDIGAAALLFNHHGHGTIELYKLIKDKIFCYRPESANVFSPNIESETAEYLCALALTMKDESLLGIAVIRFNTIPSDTEVMENKILRIAKSIM